MTSFVTMKSLIKELKELSVPGVLFIYQKDRKVRIVNSSNGVSSIQRILPELDGDERIEFQSSGIPNIKFRSLLCYIDKRRLEGLGYKVVSSIKRWGIYKHIEIVGGELKWVVRMKNTYSSIMVGIFGKEEMEEFLKAYYPCGVISAAIISSNKATKEWYEIHPEG